VPRPVELRFSRASGRPARPTRRLTDAIAQAKAAAFGIRARKFDADPFLRRLRLLRL